jgi:thioesterase domain-containing protein
VINNGVGTSGGLDKAFGGAFGSGLDGRCRETIEKILEVKPQKVNLAGHSRGAVLCHMIANDLATSGFAGEINMVVLDPVNQSSHIHRAKMLKKAMKLGEYVAMVMENISKGLDAMKFPLTEVQALDAKYLQRMHVINMPGKHGSGTQLNTAIG